MKKVITYGSFDLFHEGHYRLLQRAKALGDYLIVGVTTEEYGAKAPRPRNSRLSKTKLTERGFSPLPPWQDALKCFLVQMEV